MREPTVRTRPGSAIEKQIPVGFVLAALIVMVVGAIAYVAVRASDAINHEVTHTREVIEALEQAQINLLDIETNVRGFYVSADVAYETAYEEALAGLPGYLARVRRLTADNPAQQSRLEQLQPMIDARLAQLSEAVENRKTLTLEQAAAQIKPGQGKQTMDEIRALINAMVADENNLLTTRMAAADVGTQTTLLTLLLLTFLTLFILAVTYGLFRRDVTGRKRVEATLNAERDSLRALVDALPDLIFIKQPDGKFLLANQAMADNLGLPGPEVLLGKTDFDFFPREMAERYRVDDVAIFTSGVPVINREEPIMLANNRLIVSLTTKIPLRGPDGSVNRIVGIGHNITERKEYEDHIEGLNENLKRRTEQVEAVNKELEAFSYTISHDLRAPLRAIRGFSKLMLDDYSSAVPPEGQRFLKLVDDNARQMAELIDDLLTFSRLGRQPVTKESVDVGELVRQLWSELIVDQADRQITFRLEALPPSHADRKLLRQVFFNLLSNAIKFTSRETEACIDVGLEQREGQVAYFVRDNGAGFDMKYYDKLFGVFQRLHRAEDYEGTGVGLAIVKRIVRRHGGRVWAEAKLNEGATFYFTLDGEEPSAGD